MHIVVLTGAGISAESGIPTFRGPGGLWEGHSLEEVATPEAWERNPELVLRFYNERRRMVAAAQPNAAHLALAALERNHEVTIITQNIDDLHERSGSKRILHLHGEIMKARSNTDSQLVVDWGSRDISIGDACQLGSQLRPHVVWFGEEVPEYFNAIPIVENAELLMVVGTSLQVYPAAGLVDFAPAGIPVYWIDPNAGIGGETSFSAGVQLLPYAEAAGTALPRLVDELLKQPK